MVNYARAFGQTVAANYIHVHGTSLTKRLQSTIQYGFLGVYKYIVKFARIKTYLQIQRNIGKIMLIKIMIVTDILFS